MQRMKSKAFWARQWMLEALDAYYGGADNRDRFWNLDALYAWVYGVAFWLDFED